MSKSLIITKGVSVPLAPADVTPGEILLEEFMKPLGLTGNALAQKMDVDPMRISQIIRGKRAITAETALLLATIFETSARFWLGLQADHDLASAARIRHPIRRIGRRPNAIRGIRRCPGCGKPMPGKEALFVKPRKKVPALPTHEKASSGEELP
jgi:addiction module HigA family antidote